MFTASFSFLPTVSYAYILPAVAAWFCVANKENKYRISDKNGFKTK